MTDRRNSTAASDALFERALKVMPGGSTRATIFFNPHPPYAARGEGCWIHDVDGNRLLDMTNNFFSQIHGHAHPAIVDAVLAKVRDGFSFGLPTETEVLLAEHLCARAPAFDTIRFCNSGTEAVMTAIKAARAFTGRAKVAKIEGAYHGSYDHAEISLDSSPRDWGGREPARIGYARGTPGAVVEDTLVIPFNDPDAATALLDAHGSGIAALLLDPLPSRVGLVPATPAFIRALREATRRHGIVLIVDEIVCFRLSHAGAHPLYDLEPDLVTLGKIIGGGFPIGAITGRRDIMDVFDTRPGKAPVPQGGTFTANPMTMAAGLAAMQLLTPAAYDHLNGLGDRLRDAARAAIARAGLPAQVTGQGSLFRLHLNDRDLADYRTSYAGPEEKTGAAALHRHFLDNGILVTPQISGALSTPMTGAEIDRFVAVLEEGLAGLAAGRLRAA